MSLLVYPVKDLANAKALFHEIGLDPSGHTNGPLAY